MLAQDLHIHTVYSLGDSSIVPEQTLALIHRLGHARTIGISDHFEFLAPKVDQDDNYYRYREEVRQFGFYLGTEINGHVWVERALEYDFDYYVFHCFDTPMDYKAAARLVDTGKPVIIAHPLILETNLKRVPREAFVEINNRYIWRSNWQRLKPFAKQFRFVTSSDAHQPNWLNQNVAQCVAQELGIEPCMVFYS
jgi:histidinol phosphatase-like PHP family hydrolase